jgi:anti-anti-sigma factor
VLSPLQALSLMNLTPFDIAERDDADGARRLTVTGELDLATAPKLRERLSELQAARRNVRLDLSQLEFIDSTGIGIIARGLRDAERGLWVLDVDPNLPRQVARLLTIAGIADKLRGQQGERGHARPGPARQSVKSELYAWNE